MDQQKRYAIGFIGAGNMATALARGVIAAGLVEPMNLCASDVSEQNRSTFVQKTGAVGRSSNLDVVMNSQMIVLAVKPQVIDNVLQEVGPRLKRPQRVVSIAAGVSTARVEKHCADAVSVIRVMPNTPALVGLGMSAISRGKHANDEDIARVRRVFEAVGQVVEVDEKQMEAVTAVSGSGPAYFFYMIESLAAAGLAEGLPEETAWTLARQTALGAATLASRSEEPVEELRRRVTSPGGTTEAAIRVMTEAGFRDIVLKAVQAAANRGRELGKQS